MDLTGLQIRVLICVAAHDRMSLRRGSGQGCRASNKRMASMIGCHHAKLCSTLSKLCALGLIQREKHGRHTVYRVVYNDEDNSIFSGSAEGTKLRQLENNEDPISCRANPQNIEITSKKGDQYIPLNEEKDSTETCHENSSNPDRYHDQSISLEAATPAASDRFRMEIEEFESQWRLDWTVFRGRLQERFSRLQMIAEATALDRCNVLQKRAEGLANRVREIGFETGEPVYDPADPGV